MTGRGLAVAAAEQEGETLQVLAQLAAWVSGCRHGLEAGVTTRYHRTVMGLDQKFAPVP